MNRKTIRPGLVCVLLMALTCILPAQDSKVVDTSEINLDDLLNTEVSVAGKKAQSISESAGIISVITADDIRNMGAIDLSDVFSYVPGFTFSDNYWTRGMITSREVFQSLYNDKILMLIDGMPAYEAVNTEYYLDLIPVEAVKRIEIIRGPGSTLYGTNAFAGVINIVTFRGEEVNGGSLKTLVGPNFFFEKTAVVGRKTGEVDLFFAGNVRDDQGAVNLINRDEGKNTNIRQSSRKEFQRAHLRFGWKDFSAALQLLELGYDHFGMTPNLIHQGAVKQQVYNFTLGFARSLSKKLATSNSFRVMKQVRDNEAGTFLVGLPRVDGKPSTTPSFIDWKSVIFQLESQWNYTVSDQLSLVGGVTAERKDPYNITSMYDEWGLNDLERIVGGEGSYIYPPEKNKIDYGLYLQGDYRAKRFGIVGGVRYTRLGVVEKSFVAPRAALLFNIAKGLNLKALYGMAFRAPTIYETQVFVKNVLYGGKETIDPEKVSSYEVGLDYVGKKFSARANFYSMSIEDLIARRPPTDTEKAQLGATGGVIYDNISNQKMSGLEIELKAYPTQNLNFFLNGSLRTGKDSDRDVELNYLAKTLLSGGINWKVPSLKSDISPYFYYVSKRNGLALDGNTYTFDGYFVFNFRFGFRLIERLDLDLIVRNLTDEAYEYPEMTRNKVGIRLPSGLPRAAYIQLVYRFPFNK